MNNTYTEQQTERSIYITSRNKVGSRYSLKILSSQYQWVVEVLLYFGHPRPYHKLSLSIIPDILIMTLSIWVIIDKLQLKGSYPSSRQ